MSKSKGIGLRLEDEQYAALEQIAAETKQKPAQLISAAIDALVKHYERCGRRLVLPIDFGEMIQFLNSAPRAADGPEKPYGSKKPKK